MFPSLFDLNQGKRPFSTGFAAADLSTSACEQLGHNSNGSSSSSLPLMMHQQVARGKSFHPLFHLPSRVRVSTHTRTPTLSLMVHISPVDPHRPTQEPQRCHPLPSTPTTRGGASPQCTYRHHQVDRTFIVFRERMLLLYTTFPLINASSITHLCPHVGATLSAHFLYH